MNGEECAAPCLLIRTQGELQRLCTTRSTASARDEPRAKTKDVQLNFPYNVDPKTAVFTSIHTSVMAGLLRATADYSDLHNGTICNRTWSTAVPASIQRTPPIMLTNLGRPLKHHVSPRTPMPLLPRLIVRGIGVQHARLHKRRLHAFAIVRAACKLHRGVIWRTTCSLWALPTRVSLGVYCADQTTS